MPIQSNSDLELNQALILLNIVMDRIVAEQIVIEQSLPFQSQVMYQDNMNVVPGGFEYNELPYTDEFISYFGSRSSYGVLQIVYALIQSTLEREHRNE